MRKLLYLKDLNLDMIESTYDSIIDLAGKNIPANFSKANLDNLFKLKTRHIKIKIDK
jgi:hypothetical protein